jgi:hypothetical protein
MSDLVEYLERTKSEAAAMSRDDLEEFALAAMLKSREICDYAVADRPTRLREMSASANDIWLHWRMLVDGD